MAEKWSKMAKTGFRRKIDLKKLFFGFFRFFSILWGSLGMLGGRGIWGGGWGCRGRCVGEISGRDVVFWPKMVEKWPKVGKMAKNWFWPKNRDQWKERGKSKSRTQRNTLDRLG